MSGRSLTRGGPLKQNDLRETRAYRSGDFDLPPRPTYYTRPMSPAWSMPLEIDRLGSGEADREFAVPLAEMPRLRSQFASVGGSVHGRIRFGREAGFVV